MHHNLNTMWNGVNLNRTFLLGIIAVVLEGCSSDEPSQVIADNPVLFESATSESEQDVTTTYDIPAFRVSAFSNNQWGSATLMDNVVVTRTGLNSWIYSPAVEWPEDESVDFFAVSPTSVFIQNNQWWFHTFRYDNTKCDTDLLISVSTGNYQTSQRLKLNFRHALARVQIRLKRSDPNNIVNVTEVEICNVSGSGTFYYPASSTTANTNRGELFDCWRTYNSQDDFVVFRTDEGNSITLSDEPISVGPSNIFMIPDSLTTLHEESIWEGSHIKVEYTVNGQSRTGRYPIQEATPENRWLPGQSYLYTIDLGHINKIASKISSI